MMPITTARRRSGTETSPRIAAVLPDPASATVLARVFQTRAVRPVSVPRTARTMIVPLKAFMG